MPRAYWARRLANSSRTLCGRPHIGTTSTRPSRTSRSTSSPVMPACRAARGPRARSRAAAAWPKRVRAQKPPVPIVPRVRLGVALASDHGRLDVAALVVDPQVELEIGPVARQRVHDPLEVVGAERHRESVHRPPLQSVACRRRPRRARRPVPRAARGRRACSTAPTAASSTCSGPTPPSTSRARSRTTSSRSQPGTAATRRC